LTLYTFTLLATGVDEEDLDALYEAGCDDAIVSFDAGQSEIEFDRAAPSLLEAIRTAIAATESAGATVVRVEPDSLVPASAIAERMGRTRQSVDMLIKGQRGPGSFPPPVAGASRHPLWRWSEVEDWFVDYTGYRPDRERTAVIGAFNGALEARRNVRVSDDPDLARSAAQLVGAA
jgi:predicted DNA-binding transcriptional regulator AlpA